jgi:hypothetical protein
MEVTNGLGLDTQSRFFELFSIDKRPGLGLPSLYRTTGALDAMGLEIYLTPRVTSTR